MILRTAKQLHVSLLDHLQGSRTIIYLTANNLTSLSGDTVLRTICSSYSQQICTDKSSSQSKNEGDLKRSCVGTALKIVIS